ncbi:glycosyltransferase [Cupriavidus basilensis]
MLTLCIAARNVGMARAAGAAHALSLGMRWLAFTDADTIVSPDWLSTQLQLGTDAVCGCVSIEDWQDNGESVRHHYLERYCEQDGHRHIHGANLAVAAAACVRCGGFLPLQRCEDVALVRALQASGASIAWSAAPRVVTSARRHARVRDGFAGYLRALADEPHSGLTGRRSV